MNIKFLSAFLRFFTGIFKKKSAATIANDKIINGFKPVGNKHITSAEINRLYLISLKKMKKSEKNR